METCTNGQCRSGADPCSNDEVCNESTNRCVSDAQDPEPPRCSPPRTPASPSPAHRATDVSTTITLTWASDPAADGFEVYMGTDSTREPEELMEEVGTNRLTADEFAPGITYYWRVEAVNECGDVVAGPTWRFTTRTYEISDRTDPQDAQAPQDVPTARRTSSPCGAFGMLGMVFLIACCASMKLVRIRR